MEERDWAGTKDLHELIEGYASLLDKSEVEVIVAFGGARVEGWRGMKFANMSQIEDDAQDREFGNETHPDAYLYRADGAHMGDESSLKLFLDYLRDGYANFDQRFLTLWDHGGSYRGFGNDTNFNNDGLWLDEMARAFERSQAGTFDLIGFDACFMASVEVAKIIAPNARYMIASEELEPGHGWLWSAVIQSYAREDSIVEAGKQMVDNFVQDVHDSEDDGKTLSLLDLSRYDRLEAALNPVVSAYGQRMFSNREYSDSLIFGVSGSRSYGESHKVGSRTSIDVKHFAQLLLAELPNAEVSSSLEELIAAVDSFVVHSNHDNSRPNSFGIAIDAPENAGDEYAAYKVSDAWLDFQDDFQEFLQSDVEPPELTDSYIADDGAITVAFEDENLAGVTTLYGFVESVESEDYFMVVAELEAYPAESAGEYYAPIWDQWWFTVEYDSQEWAAWIPASFAERFIGSDGREYTTYLSEVDYYRAGASVPDNAVMTLLVDENMEVVNHQIQTYQYVYTSQEDEDGEVRFDKATFRIAPGDAVQFWNWGFHMDDPSGDGWFEASHIIDFVQAPVFQLEFLEFEDQFGQPIEYQQAMWAEDASGNGEFYLFAETPEIPFAVFEDPHGYFQALVPEGWAEEYPDSTAGEIFSASDQNGNAGVSIYVYDEVVDSLEAVADEFENQLIQDGAEGVVRVASETAQGVPVTVFEYSFGDAAYAAMTYLFDDGASVFIIYSFIPTDQFDLDAFDSMATYSFDAFWVN